MPLRTAGCKMRIVHITANDEAVCRELREIDVEKRKPGSTLRRHVLAAAARCRQENAGRDSWIGKILTIHLRAEQEPNGVAAKGMTDRADACMIHPASNGWRLPFNFGQLVKDRLHLIDTLAPEEWRAG